MHFFFSLFLQALKHTNGVVQYFHIPVFDHIQLFALQISPRGIPSLVFATTQTAAAPYKKI